MSVYTDWIETGFTVNPQGRGDNEIVLIGKSLQESLQVLDHRFAISIAPRRQSGKFSRYSLPTLICWASLDEKTTDMSIPTHWLKLYEPLFPQTPFSPSISQNTLLVTLVQPVLLTEVIIAALSGEAYRAAHAQGTLLEDWLSRDGLILRQGDIYTCDSELRYLNGHNTVNPRQVLRYQLDMVEPVLQGYARKGITRFVITMASVLGEDISISDILPEDGTESDAEGIEINEGFLASYSRKQSTFPETRFYAESLTEPVYPVEDDCTLYLRTADLGRVGVLSGDWAVAHSWDKLRYRLVRIVAFDNLVHTAGTAMGSPLLLRNISGESPAAATTPIFLHAGPFGSLKPTIPVAKTVTVARVASPLSIDRSYQSLCLRALKRHFTGNRRLVKLGDMIAVGIDTDTIHQIHEADSNTVDDTLDTSEPLILETGFPDFLTRLNAVVYFIITNVEHDVFRSDESAQDMYAGSTVGELGCWIDSTVTRIIQTGVEHSRVPIVGGYIGLGRPNNLHLTLQDHPSSCPPGLGIAFNRVFAISSATLARQAVDYSLPLSLLLKGARGTGKFTVANWVAQCLGMHLLEVNCYDIIGDNEAKAEAALRVRFDKASACSPCIIVLRYVEALAQTTQTLEEGKKLPLENVLRDCIGDLQRTWKATGYPVLVFATTTEPGKVPIGVLPRFKYDVLFEAPCERDRYDILSSLLVGYTLSPDVSLSTIATQTAALVASDLADLVVRARSASIDRVMRITSSAEIHLTQAGIPLTAADFDVALGKARVSYSENIGAPKIPSVSWDDVGGLDNVKSDILDTIQLPLDHPELFSDGLKKRSGILLYGPPGTGKTLLAKAVATSCSLNFFSVKGPELLNMYIGESEANVRRVFQRARDAKPCVIFFDELDSVAPKRGNLGDSGGVMDRIVSQLLAELDGMSAGIGGADVFVIGATNRPDLLDPALLRPGRFDRLLYLGVSDTHIAQLNILEALTRNFRLDPGINLSYLAAQCPFNYTGADFYALCSDAMLNAMSRKAAEIDSKIELINNNLGPRVHPHSLNPQYYLAELASSTDIDVLVSQQDFDLALSNLVPSVSQSDMDRYAVIQRRFSRELPPQIEAFR